MSDGMAVKYIKGFVSNLKEQFAKVADPNLTPKEKAAAVLSPLSWFTSFTGRNVTVPTVCKFVIARLNGMGQSDFERISKHMRGLTKDQIRNEILERSDNGLKKENAQKVAAGIKQFVRQCPEDMQILLAVTLSQTLPPNLNKLGFAVMGHDPKDPLDGWIRQWRNAANAMPEADLADTLLKMKGLDIEPVVDAAYEIAQKCTPAAVETFVTHVQQNLTYAELEKAVRFGAGFGEELAIAVRDDKYQALAASKKRTESIGAMRELLSILETAALKAQLTPDTNPLDAYKKARQDAKKPGPGQPQP
jgi:hypothetical protein